MAEKSMNLPVPLGIRNGPTKLMSELGFSKDYKWEAGFHSDISYLPDEIKNEKFYFPSKDQK